jgi:hypothetical protein
MQALAEVRQKESAMDAAVKSGATTPTWLDARLAGEGVRYVDEV